MPVVLLFIVVFFVNVYGIYYNLPLRNNKSNRLVLLVLLVVLLQFLSGLLIRFSFPGIINLFLAFPFSLLFGPIVFLFYKQYHNGEMPQKYYLHFMPFFLTFSCFVFLTCDAPFRYMYYDQFFKLTNIISAILYLSYILWIVFRLATTGSSLAPLFQICKRWMIPTFLMLIFIFSIVLLELQEGDLKTYQIIKLIFLLVFLFPVIQFSYLKMNHLVNGSSKLLVDAGKDAISENVAEVSEKELVALSLEVEFLYGQKIELFIMAKGYLDIDLNREQFCKQLEIRKNDLGPFLKKSYKTNFNGFINRLRLVYASQLLSQEEFVYTIDDLSFICGFNSRASFYRNFITEFGCSPHQYRTTVQLSTSKS